jgi:hypothetical protein
MTATQQEQELDSSGEVQRDPTTYSEQEMLESPDIYRRVADYIRARQALARPVPGESELIVLGWGMPDRRLSYDDQYLQLKLRAVTEEKLGRTAVNVALEENLS